MGTDIRKQKKLTKTVVDGLTPPDNGYSIHFDSELKGFAVRVTAGGVKTFVIERRVDGKVRRMKIGRYGDLTCEQARKIAQKTVLEIASGINPMAAQKKRQLKAKTLQEVFDDYRQARKNLKPTTVKDMARALSESFGDWLDKPVVNITPDMVAKRHKLRGQVSPARSNLSMRYLRALFNYAIAEYQTDGKPLLTANPVKKLNDTRAWFRVDRRKVIIKGHELADWFKAVNNLPSPDRRDYFITLLLTGLRQNEGLSLTWQNVDLKGRTLTVIDPKNRQDLTLPLSDYLYQLMERRKAAAASDYVFADHNGKPIKSFRAALVQVREESGIDFNLHDLRRTFATIAESLDIPAYTIKRLLNHADGADVTAGYIVITPDRLIEPMQKITDTILGKAGAKQTAEIIPFNKAKGASKP